MNISVESQDLDKFPLPNLNELLELDPYLKDFEQDIKRR